MKKIREAKAKRKDDEDDEDPPEPPKPNPKAQRNFPDPESRVMPTKDGFQQCYNAQAGVDSKAQVVVACSVGNSSADNPTLLPTLDQIKANLGRKPKVCSADAGAAEKGRIPAEPRPKKPAGPAFQ
jgi:hypothetical protein